MVTNGKSNIFKGMNKIIFTFLILFLPTITFGVSNYERQPPETQIQSGSDITIIFDYDGTDTASRIRTGLFLFDDLGDKVECHQFDVTAGGSGNVDYTFTGLPDGEYYDIRWGLISSSAPTYPVCDNVTSISSYESIIDTKRTLEQGTPAFEILEISSTTSTTTATSTASLGDIAFGQAIIITLLSFGLIGFIYRGLNKK